MTILENEFLRLTAESFLSIEDKCARTVFRLDGAVPDTVRSNASELSFSLECGGVPLLFSFRLEGKALVRTFSADAAAAFAEPAVDPFFFRITPGDTGIYPIGTGCAFPVDDPTLEIRERMFLFDGYSAAMCLFGFLCGGRCVIQAAKAGFDAEIRNFRDGTGLLHSAFAWHPEKGRWGYDRETRTFFGADFNEAVALCREWREQTGWRRTLRDKMRETPALALLRGAADCWIWDDNAMNRLYARPELPDVPERNSAEIAAEMRELGMDRILWNSFEGETPEACETLRRTGFLVGKYEVYRDVIPKPLVDLIVPYRVNRSVNTPLWPEIVRRNPDGSPAESWALHGLDGAMHPQHAVCDIPALELTMRNVPPDVKRVGYNSRFIDVQAGSALRECYAPEHPMTRSSAAKYIRMQEQFLSDLGLVNGVEVGAEMFAANFHYSEGMMSLPQYRAEDSGRRMCTMYFGDEIPAQIRDYMLNAKYRIPLWQMLYHDCVVSYWYWGDSSNSVPELMPLRDLFCALYGEPPLYSLNVSQWNQWKEKIAESYRRATPVAARTFSEQMVSFEYLTPDKLVQRTRFADGTAVTANFSGTGFALPSGEVLSPLQYHLES